MLTIAKVDGCAKESFLKGKDQYNWPPLDQLFLILKIKFLIFTKQAILTRKSTVLSLPIQVELTLSYIPF
jgi:hypothetical protein